MSYYTGQLQNLVEGLKGGLDPGFGLDQLADIRGEHMAKIEARKAQQAELAAAQQASLGDLASLAIGAAGDPNSLQDVMRIFTAQQAITGGDPEAGLDALFLPGNEAGRPAGLSRIDPTLPPDFAADIQEFARTGEMTIDEIHQRAQSYLGPATYQRLAPDIDKVYEEARGY